MVSIDEWLVSGEEISYDTKEYELDVDGESNFRGIITNQRAIFLTENRIHEIKNSHVDAMSFTRRVYVGLLIGGILSLIAGGYFEFGGYDPLQGRQVGTLALNYLASILFVLGGILILIFIFYRPETLNIFAGRRVMFVGGPKNLLKNIVKEIRKND